MSIDNLKTLSSKGGIIFYNTRDEVYRHGFVFIYINHGLND
jgi:hypothetical protein